MTPRNGFFLSCLLPLVYLGAANGQLLDMYPARYAPKHPPTREELNERASLHQYLFGVLCERDDRLLEALKAYEKAAELDPKAAGAFKAQVPILIVLDRPGDALERAEKTLTLDPADFEVALAATRLYKVLGKYREAAQTLEKAALQPTLKDTPSLAQQIYFDLGALLESLEEFGKAATAFSKAADILDHPETLLREGPFHRPLIQAKAAETHERIGHLYRKAKEFDKAAAAFQKAQERLPDRAHRLSWNLAQVAQEQGRFEQALKHVDEYLRLQPVNPEPYHLKIDLLTRLKRGGDIVPWLEKTTQTDPHNTAIKMMLADALEKAGKLDEAEKVFRALAEESPDPGAYKGLFRVLRGNPDRGMVQVLFQLDKTIAKASRKPPLPGDLAQAKGMIQALRGDEDLSRALVEVASRLGKADGDLQFETLHLLAAFADRHRKLDAAERFYRKCLKDTTPGLEPLVFGGLLRILWKARKYEAVIDICKEGLEKSKTTNALLFHNDLGKAHARLGNFKEALAAIDQAVAVAGEQHLLTVKLTRVRILLQAGRNDEAEKDCAALLKEFPQPGDIAEVRYLLSSVYSAQKRMDRAEEQLEMILKTDPANATVNNDLGYLWADQNKNLERAEEMIRRALELDRTRRKVSQDVDEEDQDNAAFVDSLGWVLFRRGKVEEARGELERAVKLPGGDDPTLYDHLGDVYFQLKQYPQAQTAWETSLKLFEKEGPRRHEDRFREVQEKLKGLEIRGGVK